MELCFLLPELLVEHLFLSQFLSPPQFDLLFLKFINFLISFIYLDPPIKLVFLGLLQLPLLVFELFEDKLLGCIPNRLFALQLFLEIFDLFFSRFLLLDVITLNEDHLLESVALQIS